MLKGKTALVTGSTSGIGLAIAHALAREGANIMLNGFGDKAEIEKIRAGTEKDFGVKARYSAADMTKPAEIADMIRTAEKEFGTLDVLVNNAGINIDRTMKNLAIDDWEKVIQVDLNGSFYTVKAALPYFMQQKSGNIINISSVTAWRGMFGQTNYAAAKAGIIGFTRSAALELARYNVTVNVVAPGYTRSEMYDSIPEKTKEGILNQIPLGRVCEPEEVARAVRYLIVDGDYVTGTTLNISGGVYFS